MQRSMVSQTYHGQRAGTYLQQLVCRSTAKLQSDKIRTSLTILAARHDALRLRFHWSDDGEPLQSIADSVAILCSVHEWVGEKELMDFLRQDRANGLDLSESPLVRASIFQPAGGTIVVLTFHHAIMDGRAHEIVLAELFRLCESDNPRPELLPAAHRQYSDYLDWLGGQVFSGSAGYWSGQLANMDTAADLPLPKPPVPSEIAQGIIHAVVPAAATSALRGLAAACGCSLNNVVQAAWSILLARYLGREDVVIGAVRACRYSSREVDTSNMVGLLMNTVPMRCAVGSSKPLRVLLAELAQAQRQLRDYETTPLEEVMRMVGLPPGTRIFHAYLAFEDRERPQSPGWTVELHEQTEFLNLSVQAGAELAVTLEYQRGEYADQAMSRFLADFLRLTGLLPESADRTIAGLAFFEPSVILNPAPPPSHGGVLAAVRAWSRQTPDQVAVADSNGSLSYIDLDRRSDSLAHWIATKGIPAGSVVGITIERSTDLIVAFLGVWKAGCAWLPINPGDPPNRRDHIVSDSQAVLVRDRLPEDLEPVAAGAAQVDGGQAAYVLYTSGSSGKPKGVVIPHRGVTNLCSAIGRAFGLTSEDRVLQASALTFDIAVEEIFPALWCGATVVLRDDCTVSSTREFLDFASRWRCTILDLPTAFWHELVQGLQVSGERLPPSVRLLVVGGERVSPPVFQTWRALPGTASVRWLNTYGPTEATVTATLFDPGSHKDNGSDLWDVPIGGPIENVNVYVLDEGLGVLPLEAAGELFIGGEGVALGYLNAPDLNRTCFLPDVQTPDKVMYKTGDRVRLRGDGHLEFLGRTDRRVKFHGYRLDPTELEQAAESHPAIRGASAHVRNGDILVLFVITRTGSAVGSDEIRKWLAQSLPAWMLPSFVLLTPAFPLTRNGKVDVEELSRFPLNTDSSRARPVAVPQTEWEQRLLTLWEAIFQKAHLGVDDNFFHLGGYSLLALRMLVQVEKTMGVRLFFGDLNRAPTVRQLAARIQGNALSNLPQCLVSLQAGGSAKTLFLFHGAGGQTHWYNDLAKELNGHTIIGVQCPDDFRPSSLEEMAEYYLGHIRQFQPAGPYYFLGHSMGGILAYHCSAVCEKAGLEVATTVTLDGWNPAADNPTKTQKMLRLARHFWSLDLGGKLEFAAEKLHWLNFEKSQREARREVGAEDNAEVGLKDHNYSLAMRYNPPGFGGTVRVFRAGQRAATELPDPMLGWGAVAAKVVSVEVPGTHYTMLGQPNVKTLASNILKCLG